MSSCSMMSVSQLQGTDAHQPSQGELAEEGKSPDRWHSRRNFDMHKDGVGVQ